MRIVCLGGGPAGLYFAIAAALRDRSYQITVFEQDPPGATYGWGVTFTESLFDLLFEQDPPSAARLHSAAVLWQERELRLSGRPIVHLPGYGYGIARGTLLEILDERARALGVDVRHHTRVDDPTEHVDADLVVAADGAHSSTRDARREVFGTTIERAANCFIWLGSDHMFTHLTFALESTPAGPIWLHGYPAVEGISTCVVECAPATRDALGLTEPDGIARLARIFAGPLAGRSLLARSRTDTARWQRFEVVRNRTWVHGNTVLIGDAAHTTHFSLGRGTRLALVDAVALATVLHHHADRARALADFDGARRSALARAQATAQHSMTWFEDMAAHARLSPLAFASAMSGGPPRARWRDRLAQSDAARRRARRRDQREVAARMVSRRDSVVANTADGS